MPVQTWGKQMREPPIDWLKALILERMEAKKISQQKLADKIGKTPQWVSALLKTSPWDWKSETRIAVCKALGIGEELMKQCYAGK